MTDTHLISIIVPVYNGKEYLQNIFDILERQTYQNYEVIFVNDFSTDDTLEILEEYSQNDKRIKVINRITKGGTAVAGYEYGLSFCEGEYFFSMSQDDFFDDDFLEKCLATAVEMEADTVIPNILLYYNKEHVVRHGKYPLDGNYMSVLEPKEAFLLSLEWNISGFALRRMELVKRIGFKADYYNSCEYYGRIMLLNSNKVAFSDTNFYYRQSNMDAITKGFHYFQVDVLTTDIMLFKYMMKLEKDKKKLKNRIKKITKNFLHWIKDYFATPMTKTEKRYVGKSLLNVFRELCTLWICIFVN